MCVFEVMKIAKKIREARIAKNMTQMNLAEAMEVSYQAVSSWERGNSMPDISKLEKLCSVLQVSVDELLGAASLSQTVKKVSHTNSTLTMAELEALASVLPPEELEEHVKKTAAKLPKLEFSSIIALAPFLSRECLTRLLEKTELHSFEEILDLASYLPKETLSKLIDKIPKIRVYK